MGSLKALQDWCRNQCESYNDVNITNMSSSFRDGLAFCAIIHRHRPDLIDFDSLSKENVFENNRLAFEVAESELGIPALLDPEDMVSMRVPDRLSIITYVSQYYNYFTNKSQTVPPCIKIPGGPGHIKPAIKRPFAPLEDRDAQTESGADSQSKRSTLSSTCSVCGKHVHLVQRILIDGKLYHRNCFRCRECSRTLLPGSYKFTEDPGSLVCTHHFTRSVSNNKNGHSDMSNRLVTLTSTSPKDTHSKSLESKASHSDVEITQERKEKEISEIEEAVREESDSSSNVETEHREPRSSSPPNPFDESEEEDQDTQKEDQKLADNVANGDRPTTKVKGTAAEGRPVPAPRRVFEATPAPRPVPRQRPPRPSENPTVSAADIQISQVPVPRERLHSPVRSSKASDTPKPKDPPWLALVQSETKKKPAPRPPTGIAPPCTGSSPSLKEEGSRPSTPPNPFEDEKEEEPETGLEDPPGPVVASHPWYSITQAAEVAGGNTRRQSPAPSESPVSVRRKKRPAPKAPNSSTSAFPSSQTSSPASSLALSTESLSSSSSDYSAVPQQPAANEQDHLFTKSVSEPSINTPTSALSPTTELQPHCSPNLSPPPPPTNTSSAPATPQTNRSMRTPPSCLSAGLKLSPSSQTPSTPGKRTCKENPFNRKTTTSVSSFVPRPPRGPRPARPPAPGHGFPLIKRKVQSDQYIPVEDIHVEMSDLEKRLDELEQRGVDLEKSLRECSNDDEEEHLLVDWFTLIHEKHLLVRREAELVYTAKQQNLEERQADVEYELRCLLNKPEKEWTEEDKDREKQLMAELVTIIEQRNQIVNNMDMDRQREEEEDKLVAAMLKKKEFHGQGEQKKKAGKFKPMKVLKRLSTKNEGVKDISPRKENS
ncbi:MICAL-like protein 1 isoform X3 [Megalobrama amblycephala]|uniref:MICAL-like protein 1 isoform X3 n=1 Tax=Megalobrama amblycephala TaxID=75352 RepID=UPI002013C144|nr:MICAL-like protein 1 isoform X3 [Megalobrama amblycephala]